MRRLLTLLILLAALLPWEASAPAARAQLAASPWPMLRHDPQHTGRSPYAGPQLPALKWSFATEGKIQSSPAIGPDGTVYVGSLDHKLYALNPDGSLKWSFTTGHWVRSSAVVGADATLYVGSYDGNLYAINPDGTLKWSFNTPPFIIFSSPAIGADGTLYVGSSGANVSAINPDGTLKWSSPIGDEASSLAVAADGTLYVGSLDNKLYAINHDGTLKWSFLTGGWVLSAPAIGADGTLYVGSLDTKIYALNADGTLRWSFPTGSWVPSSPAVGAGGTIYVGSDDYKIYAINGDGTLRWSFATGDLITSSPAIGADGTLYVGSWDGKLYAIGEATTASPSLKAAQDTDAAAGVAFSIPQVYDAITLSPLPSVTIGSYQATLQYNGALLNVLEVRHKFPFKGGDTINNPGGNALFSGLAPGGAPWPVETAFVTLRLLGCTNQPVTLTPTFGQILDNNGVPLAIQQPAPKTYRRGDAKADGTVNISDALYIAQYLAGLRGLGEDATKVNAVNAASVKQDGVFDKSSSADVLYIAQYVVGLRDGCFNLVPLGGPPQR